MLCSIRGGAYIAVFAMYVASSTHRRRGDRNRPCMRRPRAPTANVNLQRRGKPATTSEDYALAPLV
jgi:hypothetical protein